MADQDRSQHVLEGHVKHLADVFRVPICPHVEARNGFDIFEYIRLVTNVPYKNVWGKNGFIEFVLELGATQQIPIECKYQGSAGSVDEKLLKTFCDAAFYTPGDESVLLLDGKSMDPLIFRKLKTWGEAGLMEIGGNKIPIRKTVRVMNRNEFDTWFRGMARMAA